MTDQKQQEEPTMEEILASIRRIISEEGEADKAPKEGADAEPAEEPAGADDEVLELTDVVEDEDPAPEPPAEEPVVAEGEPEPAPEEEPEPELEPDFSAAPTDDAGDVVDAAREEEAIMSPAPSDQAKQSFEKLSDLLVAGYAGYDKTLEGMVREMLRPMLKEWLDDNLPQVVERVVAREVARLSRVKKP